jgi:murein DD-endopeptidase MepM/ murein hydrolase activator NlpD
LWFSLLFLVACTQESRLASGGGAAEQPLEQVTSPLVVLSTVPSSVKGSVIIRPPAQAATPLATAVVESAQAQDLPIGLAAAFQLCSPLVDTPLAELPEIVSDPYHPPPPRREERHHGVDFAYYRRNGRDSIENAGVQAVLAGTVMASLNNRFPYGNVIIIETPATALPASLNIALELPLDRSLYLLYAHLQDAPLAGVNETVTACQPLGLVGRSGNAGGAHLHLEVRSGLAGQRLESLAYYKADASPAERENYLRWRVSGDFQHIDPMRLLMEWP